MTPQDTTEANAKSGQEVAKISGSRYSAGYWETRIVRPKYTVDGARREVSEWHARVQYGGRREWVPLGSNDRRTAARRAVEFWTILRRDGWDAALAQFCPDRQTPQAVATVGEFLGAVQAAGGMRPRTLANYGYALRRIAADVAGATVRGRTRFDPTKPVWRAAADPVPLSKLTVDTVTKWRVHFVARAGADPGAQQRAKRSANSYLRNARSLFAKAVLERVAVTLPDPLPFAGVELERHLGSTRYHSNFDPAALLATARAELKPADPDAYGALLLALGAGLRRGEIDNLQLQQLDFTAQTIRVLPLRHFVPKSDDSEGTVFVDPGLLAELKALRDLQAAPSTLFVIEPQTDRRPTRAAQYYRAQATFERVTSWLRQHGVDSRTPLHGLRKEFGSILAARADIHTASRMLRHSNLQTTANYYVDARRVAVVPLAELLRVAEPGK